MSQGKWEQPQDIVQERRRVKYSILYKNKVEYVGHFPMTLFSSYYSQTFFMLFCGSSFPGFGKLGTLPSFEWLCMSELLFSRLCAMLTVCDPKNRGAPNLHRLYLRASVPHIFIQSWNMPK